MIYLRIYKRLKMKISLFIVVMFATIISSFAQDEEEEKSHKFRRDNIFIGGSVGLSLGSGGFGASGNPEIGYSIAQWLDAGISTNLNYFSFRAEYNNGIRQRSFNYGAGVFARFYPIGGFFVQVLPEYNKIRSSLKSMVTSQQETITQEAPSMLLGVGYGSRMIGNMNYFTVLMFDVGNNTNSPYIGYFGSKLPILRTGFNFYLRPKRR